MLLGLLFSILSATYTVVSSTKVSVGGETPDNSQAIYSRSGTTGQKGQMTAGHSTTLQLTGWDGCVIDSVVLNMHSNTASGAGSLYVQMGERSVWHIADAEFKDEVWNGSFSTQWVDIAGYIGKRVGANETIIIHIEASKNSLYINRYTIYYSQPDPQAYEVRFISGLGDRPSMMVEENVGSGIVLPAWVDTLDWHFLGWSETEVLEGLVCPALWKAGERYYPQYDCRLWAVYSDGVGNAAVHDCASGEYVIASAAWGVALTGGVVHEEVATIPVLIDTTANGEYLLQTGVQDEMLYHFDFKEDSTVMIWNISSMSVISHAGTDLADNDLAWRYRVLGDGSYCFYYNDKTLHRMLCVGYGKDGDSPQIVAYSIRGNVGVMKSDGFRLFSTEERTFTTWPFGKLDGVEDVVSSESSAQEGEYSMHLGNYTLHIRNGRKYLYLQ